jgi:hypothetical protein
MFSGYIGRAEASGGSREAGAFHCHSQHLGGQYQYQLEVVSVGGGTVSVGGRYPSDVIAVEGWYQLEISINGRLLLVGVGIN